MDFEHQRETIEHLTVRWRGDGREARTPATQLRLENLLGGVDLRPPGMPSGALLIIRRVRGLPPLTRLTSLDPAWARQVEQRIAALYRSAARPAHGPIPPRAAGVLFADAAEMLALLTLDVVNEGAQGLQHWYWQELVPGPARWPGAALAATWAAHVEALPAAWAQLTIDEVCAAVALLRPADVSAVVRAIHTRFALPATVLEVTLPDTLPAPPDRPGAPPWQALVPPLPPRPLAPQTMYLLGLTLTLYHASALARSSAFAEQSAAWLRTVLSGPAVAVEPSPAAITAVSLACQAAQLAASAEAGHVTQTAVQPEQHDPATQPRAPTAEPSAASDTSINMPLEPVESAQDGPISPRRKPVLPDGVPTALGGVFYLINLLAWLDWPLPPGLSGWGALEALARGLLEQAADADPLWPLLAQLDGREPGAPLSAVPVPERFRLPGPGASQQWVVVTHGQRVAILDAAAGYLIADVPRLGDSPAETVRAEMAAWGVTAAWHIDDRAPFAPLPTELRARLGPGAAFWLERVRGYVRHLLERLLDAPVAAMLRTPGRVIVSRTHIDLAIPLDRISIPVRRTGLDANPGWMPELGYIVLFHFVEE